MTLEEAIEHAEEKAQENYNMASAYHTDENVYMEEEAKCRLCAEEHEQLAGWLKELKAYKENGTKDLEKLRDDVVIKLCLGKECDRCLFEGAYGICGVKNFIAERISELKGESK